MRLLNTTILLLFILNSLFTQTAKTKALSAIDTIKEEGVWQLAIDKQLVKSINEKDSSLLASVLFAKGKRYLGQGKLDSVKTIADKAISYYKLNKINGPENFYNMKAICFSHQNNTDSAIQYFIKAATIFETKKNKIKAAYIKNNVANLFLTIKDFRQAGVYFTEIMQVLEKAKDSTYLPGIYASYAAVKQEEGNLKEAKLFVEKAKNMAVSRNDILGQLLAFRQIGLLASAEGRLADAINSFDKSMELAVMTRQIYYQSLIQMNKAEAYYEAHQYPGAEREARASLQYISFPGFQSHLPRLYTILSGSLHANGSYKEAYEYLSKAEILRDSISNLENKTILSDLNLKYETEKKDKKITTQQLEITRQQSNNKSLAIALIAIGALGIFITMVAFFNSKLQKTKIQSIKNTREKEVLNAILAGEEQERKRLASEIHDGISNSLFSSKLTLSSITTNDESVREKISLSISQIDQLRDESRRVAHNLWPARMETDGLISMCRQYFESGLKHQDNIKMYFQNFGQIETGLDNNAEMLLYRMIQELTGNAVRHSGGTEIDVQIFNDEQEIKVQVEDNGSGFDPADENLKGHGLTTIEQRLSLINGSMHIQSEKNKGSIVEIKIQK